MRALPSTPDADPSQRAEESTDHHQFEVSLCTVPRASGARLSARPASVSSTAFSSFWCRTHAPAQRLSKQELVLWPRSLATFQTLPRASKAQKALPCVPTNVFAIAPGAPQAIAVSIRTTVQPVATPVALVTSPLCSLGHGLQPPSMPILADLDHSRLLLLALKRLTHAHHGRQ